ncbi:MAG: sel1 repeat family protein [Planctomycetes bacterium]|nr:sel1 repeat family protein [Planctomycetota bacterium]
MCAATSVLRSSLLLLTALLVSACQTALHQGLSAYERGDCAAAVELWSPLAEAGDAQAQFLLGVAYDEGRGVERDAATAAKWYRLAAAQDHALAQNNLGLLHYRGDGVARSTELAAFWFARAAGHGHADASGNLGLMQARGEAPAADAHESARLLEDAASNGHRGAQIAIALLPSTAPERAARLLEQAAAGRVADQVVARQWIALAAATRLAVEKLRVDGPDRDAAGAAAMLEHAARQGFAPAQQNLALLLLRGDGIAADRGAAAAWLELAAEHGATDAGARLQQLRRTLSAGELAAAQQHLDELRPAVTSPGVAASPAR